MGSLWESNLISTLRKGELLISREWARILKFGGGRGNSFNNPKAE